MSTFVIDLHDRPGALERLLGKCRRKKLEIVTLSFGPGDAPGVRRVIVAFDEGCPDAHRITVDLAKVHDVVAVAPVDADAHAQATQATLRLKTAAA